MKQRHLIKTGLALSLSLGAAPFARADTFATPIVAPTQVPVFQFTTTTTTASPTYNRAAIATGLNIYNTNNPAGSSGIGSAVAYATSSGFVPASTGTYTINESATGFDPADYIQYIYQPALVPTTAATALQGIKYGYYPANATNSGTYNVSLTGATPYQLVNAGYYPTNNATTYPQTPGSGYYSEGTATTTVLYNNPGSTTSIPDNNATTGGTQVLTIGNSTTTISSFNSITIDGLSHPFIGDLVATLSHNGVTVDLFDHTGADNNPSDPNYNYGQGSAASFDGNNYTFSTSGASLASVPDLTSAPDGTTYITSGNAASGFDTANAGNTLNSFVGQSVTGAWTLNIKDEQPDDTGSFTGFSFNINNDGASAAPEPSEWAALGLSAFGLAGLLLRVRRRNTNNA